MNVQENSSSAKRKNVISTGEDARLEEAKPEAKTEALQPQMKFLVTFCGCVLALTMPAT